MARALAELHGRLREPLVGDQFETFEFLQGFPFGVMTLVGRGSWFIYTIDPAPHARAGRLTTAQKRRLRARPKRSHHGGYTGSSARALDRIHGLIRHSSAALRRETIAFGRRLNAILRRLFLLTPSNLRHRLKHAA